MNKIDKLQKIRNEMDQFTRWAAKYGASYSGGGGGFGHIHSARFGCDIYYQAYNGNKNYHGSEELPMDVISVLGEAAKAHAGTILETAKKMLQDRVNAAAHDARAEAEKVLELTKATQP